MQMSPTFPFIHLLVTGSHPVEHLATVESEEEEQASPGLAFLTQILLSLGPIQLKLTSHSLFDLQLSPALRIFWHFPSLPFPTAQNNPYPQDVVVEQADPAPTGLTLSKQTSAAMVVATKRDNKKTANDNFIFPD